MISHEVAIIQINRLFDNYAPMATEKIREAKLRLLRNELKDFTDARFILICNLIIRESKFRTFPTIEEFCSKTIDFKKEYINIRGCQKCEGTGYFTVWQLMQNLGNYYHFAYRCDCETENLLSLPLISPQVIPDVPHNPYPPDDSRNTEYRKRAVKMLKNGKK